MAVCPAVRRAVVRFLALWLGLYGSALALAVAVGSVTPWTLFALPSAMLMVPVNPQGRGEFYLADPS